MTERKGDLVHEGNAISVHRAKLIASCGIFDDDPMLSVSIIYCAVPLTSSLQTPLD
jgi:hypothetical protein